MGRKRHRKPRFPSPPTLACERLAVVSRGATLIVLFFDKIALRSSTRTTTPPDASSLVFLNLRRPSRNATIAVFAFWKRLKFVPFRQFVDNRWHAAKSLHPQKIEIPTITPSICFVWRAGT